MADQSTIQDYSMIDEFLTKSLDTYRKHAFGEYDSKTGYYPQQRTDDDEDVVSQELSEDADVLATDPEMDMEMSDLDMYDFMFGDSNYPRQDGEEDDFYNFSSQQEDNDYQGQDMQNSSRSQFNMPGVGKQAFSYKAGVTGQGLQPGINSLINDLSSVTGEFVITSGKRSQNENLRLKGSSKNSFHLTGEAVDIRPNKNVDKFLSSQEGKKYLADRGYEVVDERNVKGVGAHWHIEPVKRQYGGIVPVARTEEQQYVGLNDDSIQSLILPLSGTNTIRGLDSGHPVLVEDETGKQKVLYGPKHTTRMKGRVFERKLIK